MPKYVAKVLTLSGAIVADPLPASDISFNEVLSFPSARRMATFDINLIPPRGANAHYIHIYKQLDYQQRVEIYEEDTIGEPVFSGYIIDMSTDLGTWSISGEEWLGKLSQRRTAHYQPYPFTDTYVNIFQWVLDTWEHTFFDDFTGSLSAWTQTLGSWTITDEQLTNTTSPAQIDRTLSGPPEEVRYRLDFTSLARATDWGLILIIFSGGIYPWTLTITHTAGEDKTNFLLTQLNAPDFVRDAGEYELPPEVISSLDFYLHRDFGIQTCEVWLNDRQFMLSESTTPGSGGTFKIHALNSDMTFDNFIIFERQDHMQAGTIDTSPTSATAEGEYEPPQDTYIDVLSFAADQLEFEWRTRARAGQGNDQIDAAAAVGTDYSGKVIFEEGVNITNLSLSATGSKLTTTVRLAGQGNDVNMMLANIFDKSAIETYGWIEHQVSNQRISTVALARQYASNHLVKLKDGDASLSGTVMLSPMLPDLQVGDTVWVKSRVPDLDKAVKIVQIDRQSGSDTVRLTFQNFPRSRSGKIGVLDNDVGLVIRGKSINSAKQILTFTSLSRILDDYDSSIVYDDPGGPITGALTDPIWFKFLGGPAISAFDQTFHFGSDHDCVATVSIKATGFDLYSVQGFNLTQMAVFIDDPVTPYTIFNQNGPQNPGVPRILTGSIVGGTLTPTTHTVIMRKNPLLPANANAYISLDRIVLNSALWNDIFLEGRAINSAKLSYVQSNSINPVPTRIFINQVDRTLALGGPVTGFLGNQLDLDVSQFISAPGVYHIDFVFGSAEDTRIDATLAVQLFA